MATDRRTYPGLFASTSDISRAQRAAATWADAQEIPARSVEDERELRYRALARSAFLWVFIGVPLVSMAVLLLSQLVQTAIANATA